jgi:hypothetical protein
MRSRLALHPDLNECALERRALLYAGPGLSGSAFLAVNPTTNQIIVPGTSASGSGGGQNPGPNFYYLFIGTSSNTNAGLNPGSGGTISVYGLNLRAQQTGGGGSVGSANSSNNGPSSNSTNSTSGYSSAFSTGFNFALGSTNNYGMAASTLGSVPVHSFSGGGAVEQAPAASQDETADMANAAGLYQGIVPGVGGISSFGANSGIGGTGVNLWNNLLGKNPGSMGLLPSGPSTGSSSGGMNNRP